jgi:hypothetical protein
LIRSLQDGCPAVLAATTFLLVDFLVADAFLLGTFFAAGLLAGLFFGDGVLSALEDGLGAGEDVIAVI